MKKLITTIAALALSASAFAIDLREYFPASNTVLLRTPNGTANARYTFTASPSEFLSVYNTFLTLNKPGYHYTWRKEYWQNGAWCTATYAVLFMADDLSVTEVGDWYASTPCTPNIVFGYKTAQSGGANTGLIWAPPGGLTSIPAIAEMFTAAQATPGALYSTNGYKAYSKTGLIEVLATYKPPHGRDVSGTWCAGCAKTYTDVVHIIMYHGTRSPSPVQIRCGMTSPIAANGAYYQSFKDYNSYGIELYIAKDIGIIEERTPFIEDASYWGGAFPNCSGSLFGNNFVKYID